MKITAEWDQPEPDEMQVHEALMRMGFYDIDIVVDSDENPHGWGV
jgi:hypothetical protein